MRRPDTSLPLETYSGRGFASIARLQLQITPTELRIGSAAQRWSDISGAFEVRESSSYGMFALLVPRRFVVYEEVANATTERDKFLLGLRGSTRRLPSNYGMSADALAALLNERLAHHRATNVDRSTLHRADTTERIRMLWVEHTAARVPADLARDDRSDVDFTQVEAAIAKYVRASDVGAHRLASPEAIGLRGYVRELERLLAELPRGQRDHVERLRTIALLVLGE